MNPESVRVHRFVDSLLSPLLYYRLVESSKYLKWADTAVALISFALYVVRPEGLLHNWFVVSILFSVIALALDISLSVRISRYETQRTRNPEAIQNMQKKLLPTEIACLLLSVCFLVGGVIIRR